MRVKWWIIWRKFTMLERLFKFERWKIWATELTWFWLVIDGKRCPLTTQLTSCQALYLLSIHCCTESRSRRCSQSTPSYTRKPEVRNRKADVAVETDSARLLTTTTTTRWMRWYRKKRENPLRIRKYWSMTWNLRKRSRPTRLCDHHQRFAQAHAFLAYLWRHQNIEVCCVTLWQVLVAEVVNLKEPEFESTTEVKALCNEIVQTIREIMMASPVYK